MNRIVRKTLDGIETMRKKAITSKNFHLSIINPQLKLSKKIDINKSLKEIKNATTLIDFYSTFEKVINLETNNNGNIITVFDAYSSIELVLYKVCNLTDEEVGFIFDRIMKHNNIKSRDESVFIDYPRYEEDGFSETDILKLIETYYNNADELNNEEIKFVEKVIKESAELNKRFANAYVYINEFRGKLEHSKSEYEEFETALKTLNVPDRMRNAYISFYKDKEPIKIKPIEKDLIVEVENIKEEVKKEDFGLPEEIDMKDIYDIFKKIASLDLPKNTIQELLENIFSRVIKNDNYYDYLFYKAAHMGIDNNILNDIKELKEIISEEPKEELVNWLYELYGSIEHIMTESFTFEYSLMKDIKKLEKNYVYPIRGLHKIAKFNYPTCFSNSIKKDALMVFADFNKLNPQNFIAAMEIYNSTIGIEDKDLLQSQYSFLQKLITYYQGTAFKNINDNKIASFVNIWHTKTFFKYSDTKIINYRRFAEEVRDEFKNELELYLNANYNDKKNTLIGYTNDIYYQDKIKIK